MRGCPLFFREEQPCPYATKNKTIERTDLLSAARLLREKSVKWPGRKNLPEKKSESTSLMPVLLNRESGDPHRYPRKSNG